MRTLLEKMVVTRTCVVLFCLTVLATLMLYNDALWREDPPRYDMHAPQQSWDLSLIVHKALHKLKSVFVKSRARKLVLLWTPYFSQKGLWLPSTSALHCPVQDCDVTDDRALAPLSDAVVLHWRDVDPQDLPPACDRSSAGRCPLWVLFDKEAPPHTPRATLAAVQGRVHWTATYRLDSDVPAPYGMVEAAKGGSLDVIDPSGGGDRICWLVSNCNTPSRRELFVKELQKHIEIDVYGRCGPLKCPFPKAADCYGMLSKKCRVYLSLENSDCRDYITEKLFNALIHGMIPVVRGNSTDYSKHLPPRSYIDADDFSGPRELAEYLRNVTGNPAMYRSYQWWRKTHRAVDFSYRWYCRLCERLHSEPEVKSSAQSGRNLVAWWYNESGCS